jgi:hypothetical protein
MNTVFSTAFPVILVLLALRDRKLLQRNSTPVRSVYFGILTISFGMYAAKVWNIALPIPTRFFIHYVSPWMESILGLK